MTRFEEKGIALQQSADSKQHSKSLMQYSCKLCCDRGIKITCDRCAIKQMHDLVLSVFDDIEEARFRDRNVIQISKVC